MVTIYCSRRLELFLRGPLEVPAEKDDPEPILGDWNAYTVRLSAKQYVLFVNSKTGYCVPKIFERQMPDIVLWFGEVVVPQLIDDFKLSKTAEKSIRRELSQIRMCRSNNNRILNGMFKNIIRDLKFYIEELNSFAPFNELCIAIFLNGRPLGANVWARGKEEYYCALNGMKKLIEIHKVKGRRSFKQVR